MKSVPAPGGYGTIKRIVPIGVRRLRIMANVLQELRALDVPLNVVNKPGSGGAVSFAYLNQHPGDGHYLLLAVASPQRLGGVLADVPTWREQGLDAVVSNWRGMVGPKGMTAAQRAYWEEALRRFGDSEEWKKELETNFWSNDYMGGAGMRTFLDEDNAQARAFLVDIGLAK